MLLTVQFYTWNKHKAVLFNLVKFIFIWYTTVSWHFRNFWISIRPLSGSTGVNFTTTLFFIYVNDMSAVIFNIFFIICNGWFWDFWDFDKNKKGLQNLLSLHLGKTLDMELSQILTWINGVKICFAFSVKCLDAATSVAQTLSFHDLAKSEFKKANTTSVLIFYCKKLFRTQFVKTLHVMSKSNVTFTMLVQFGITVFVRRLTIVFPNLMKLK